MADEAETAGDDALPCAPRFDDDDLELHCVRMVEMPEDTSHTMSNATSNIEYCAHGHFH
jgi:hypothetical protein